MNYVIIGVVVAILIFLSCREIICWYWKINEIKDVLKSIDASLTEIKKNQSIVPVSDFSMPNEGSD